MAADLSEAVFSRRFIAWLKSSFTLRRGLARRPGLSEGLEDSEDSEDSCRREFAAFAAFTALSLGLEAGLKSLSDSPKGRGALAGELSRLS